MIVQEAHNRKNQKHGQIKLEVNWQYVDEASISFRRLMMLLLKPREDGNGKPTS